MNPRLSIVIPAYNEERRIAQTVRSVSLYLRAQDYVSEIIVVLNNCTDDTLSVVRTLEAEIPSLRHLDLGMMYHPSSTKGLAVKRGMLEAMGDYRIYIDADGAVPMEEIEMLWPHVISGIEVVFGSRYILGSKAHVSWYRRMLSRFANLLVQTLLLPGIHDTQCAFKLFTARAAKDVFSQSHIMGWGFDMEVLCIARYLGYRIREVPIRWNEMNGSSVKPRAFFEALADLINIRRKAWKGRYRSTKM